MDDEFHELMDDELHELMDDELKRRLVHASGAGPPLLYLASHSLPAVPAVAWAHLGYFYVALSLLVVVLEVGRLGGWFDWWIYDRLTREYERENLAAYALFVFSSTVVVLVFEDYVALPAVLILALVDPVSGYLGGSELQDVKRTSVLLVTFGFSVLIASFFVGPIPAVLGGAAATLADGVKPAVRGYVLDDDLTMAPAAAIAMAAGTTFLPTVGLGPWPG